MHFPHLKRNRVAVAGGLAACHAVGRQMHLDHNADGGTAVADAETETETQNAGGDEPDGETGGDSPLTPEAQQYIDDVVAEFQGFHEEVLEAVDDLRQNGNTGRGRVTGRQHANRRTGGIRGMLPSKAEKQGYQFFKVMGYQQGSSYHTKEKCKVELDVHERLSKIYVEQSGLQLSGHQSTLCPLGPAYLLSPDVGETAFAQEIAELCALGVAGASMDQFRHNLMSAGMGAHAQALSQWDDTGLGIFIETARGSMIDLIRAREAMSRAGAQGFALPPSGRLDFPKQTGATTAYWVGEGQQITASSPTTGAASMLAKKLASLVKSPNELLRFGTPSVEAFYRADIAREQALAADSAFISGPGSSVKPKGLIDGYAVTSRTAGTVAANGDTLEPEDLALVMSDLEELNYDLDIDQFSWLMRPKMWSNVLNRRADAVSAGDKAGPWLFPVNRDDIGRGVSPMISGKSVVRSSQVPNDRSKGSSTDLTAIIGGLFNHFIIGRVGVIEIATSTEGDTAFQNDQTWLRVIQHLDGLARYENAFVVIDDIDMDLPA